MAKHAAYAAPDVIKHQTGKFANIDEAAITHPSSCETSFSCRVLRTTPGLVPYLPELFLRQFVKA